MSPIIIYKPAGECPPADILEKCTSHWSSGFGFAYVKDGKFHFVKNIQSYETLHTKLTEIKEFPALIHMAEKPFTNTKEKGNIGPFRLDHENVMVHTGRTWTEDTVGKPQLSQCLNFLIILKKFWEPQFFDKEYIDFILEKGLQANNRLAILNINGECMGYPKNAGTEIYGCWFSQYIYSSQPVKKQHYSYPASLPGNFKPENQTRRSFDSSLGAMCCLCKTKYYNAAQVKYEKGKGWICFGCEKDLGGFEEVNKVIPLPDQAARIHLPDTTTPDQKKTSFLHQIMEIYNGELNLDFLEIFSVI